MNKNLLKLYIALCLLCFAKSAFAFVAAITAVAIGAAMYAGAGIIAAVAIGFAVSTLTSSLFAPTNQSAEQPKDEGVRIQVPPNTSTPIPVIYGTAWTGGKFVDAVISVDQKVMNYVMAISCVSEFGQISVDQTKMYYGDRLITFDGTDGARVISLTDGAGNVDTKIDAHLYIYMFVSDKDGNITSLTSNPSMPYQIIKTTGPNPVAAGQEWPSTGRQMNGLVFAIVRLVYNQSAGTTQLQPVTFKITQNLADEDHAGAGSVWADYMSNTIYGGAVPAENIDVASAEALNAYGNEVITFTDYDGNPQTQPRYRINGVLDTGQGVLQNVDNIMTACDSWMKYDAVTGKWAVVINKAEEAAYAFNDSNLVDAITIGSVDISQMPNEIEAKFPDKTNRDQFNYVNVKVPPILLLPNEPVNKQSLNYYLVNDSVQALYLANRTLEQNREDLLVTITTTYDGIQVNAGDVVSITNAAYDWDAKLFRAMSVKESISSQGILSARIELIEYNAQVYDNFDITQYTPAPNGGMDDVTSPFYFPSLPAPTIVNASPSATVPEFTLRVPIPSGYRTLQVDAYYQVATSAGALTEEGWNLGPNRKPINSQAFAGGSNVDFVLTGIPETPSGYQYYFAYVLSNEVGQSARSAYVSYVWTPNPTGLQGPRSSSGYIYYYAATPTAPAAPTASGYNFTTGTFSSLTAGWSTTFTAPDPVTNPATQAGSKFWAVRYNVSEVTYGGSQYVDISTVFNWQNLDGLVTFTNVQSPSGTTFIDGGNIITDTITVSRIKNNTSGTFNSGTFQLGTGASVSGIAATAAFTGTSSTWGSLVTNNSSAGAFAAVSTSTSGGAGGVFANAYNSAFNSFRTNVVAADSNYALVGNAPIWGTQGIIGQSGYAFYAGAGGYGPFTGTHDSLIANGTALNVGDIVVDTGTIVKKNINDIISIVEYSSTANESGILGVVSSATPLTNIPAALSIQETDPVSGLQTTVLNPDYQDLYDANQVITVNAVGEGQINVCGEGGDIAIGDLIVTSSTAGKGMKQSDDIIRSYTVAKARESAIFSSPTEVKMIGCTYVSG